MPLIAPTSTAVPSSSGTAATAGADGPASSAEPSGGASGALGGLGSDAFMKLLVAQMRYQNPMQPSDGTEYLAQISQYAMVEQLQKVNEGQQQVSSYQRAMIANSMIGKLVTGTGETGMVVTGEVVGVDFQAGRPVLVTTGGDLAVDKVDGTKAAAPSAATAAQAAAARPTTSPAPSGATTATTAEASSSDAAG